MGGVEHREDAQQVVRTIHRSVVYAYQVVSVVATLDMYAYIHLAAGLDAGEEFYETQRVGRSHDCREFGYSLHVYSRAGSLGRNGRSAFTGSNYGAVQGVVQ